MANGSPRTTLPRPVKILCVCDEGNNRSVHIAHLLKYRGHDTLAVGARTSQPETRRLLSGWADLTVFTDPAQMAAFPAVGDSRMWAIPDAFPRPFNVHLDGLLKARIGQEGL